MKIWILDDNLINIVRRAAILLWKARNKELNILCLRQIKRETAKMRKSWLANLPRGEHARIPYAPTKLNLDIKQ